MRVKPKRALTSKHLNFHLFSAFLQGNPYFGARCAVHALKASALGKLNLSHPILYLHFRKFLYKSANFKQRSQMKLGMRKRHLGLGILAALTVLTVLIACGTPVWALPSCRVLIVFAGQTASICISGETLNFRYDSISKMITTTGGSPGSSSFPPTLGGGYWGSDWGDCTEIMVTPYFVVFFFRPLTVLRLMGIEW
jgi:hypothetical protein